MRSIFPSQTVRAAPYVARSDYVAHARRPALRRPHRHNHAHTREMNLSGRRSYSRITNGISQGNGSRVRWDVRWERTIDGVEHQTPPPAATSWVAEIRQSARAFAPPARWR